MTKLTATTLAARQLRSIACNQLYERDTGNRPPLLRSILTDVCPQLTAVVSSTGLLTWTLSSAHPPRAQTHRPKSRRLKRATFGAPMVLLHRWRASVSGTDYRRIGWGRLSTTSEPARAFPGRAERRAELRSCELASQAEPFQTRQHLLHEIGNFL